MAASQDALYLTTGNSVPLPGFDNIWLQDPSMRDGRQIIGLSDPELREFQPRFFDEASIMAGVAWAYEETARGIGVHSRIVNLGETASIVGTISVYPVESVPKGYVPQEPFRGIPEHNLGYWGAASIRGKGIMRPAIEATLELAIERLRITEVGLDIRTDNPASQKLARKYGAYVIGQWQALGGASGTTPVTKEKWVIDL